MPLLFSYGSLQEPAVQLSTFGRLLDGQADELPRFELTRVPIEDSQVVSSTGKTYHANAKRTGSSQDRVPGTVFDVTDAELVSVDRYEAAFHYLRVQARLASGREAWVYVHE